MGISIRKLLSERGRMSSPFASSRRNFLRACAGLLSAVFTSPMIGEAVAASTFLSPGVLAMGGNLGTNDWNPTPFYDLMHNSRGFGKPGDAAENHTMRRNAAGWPQERWTVVVTHAVSRPGTEWKSGVYKGRIKHAGSTASLNLRAEFAINCTLSGITQIAGGTAFTITIPPGSTPGLALSGDIPITDMRIVHSSVNIDRHPIWTPEATAYYKRFSILRLLDIQGLNSSLDDHLKYYPTWARRVHPGKAHGSMSDEFLIAALNELMAAPGSKLKGVWVHSNPLWSETDMLSQARLWKARLNPDAYKLPELGNELWNFNYSWSGLATGAKFGIHVDANNPAHPDYRRTNTPATTDQYLRFRRRWALLVARMSRAWSAAFPGEMGTKLLPVYMGQLAGTHWIDYGMEWLQLPAQVSEFGAVNRYVKAIGAAGYIGGTVAQMDTPRTSTAFIAALRGTAWESSLPNITRGHPDGDFASYAALRRKYAIPYFFVYEWGLHLHGHSNIPVKRAVNLDPKVHPLLVDLAHMYKTYGVRLACFLTAAPMTYTTADENTLWGLSQGFTAAKSTPKNAAVNQLVTESGL